MAREYDPNVYGYYNGKPCYSEQEYTYSCRRHGAFHDDAEMIAFIKKLPANGLKRPIEKCYFSDYCLEEPRKSLTRAEFNRLLYLQQKAIEAQEEFEESLNWRYVHTVYWADNSEEELWVNGLGEEKWVMSVHPHGDLCY